MKERIIKQVVEEIQQSGMRFTVDDITNQLGISKKTIYEHFSSKEEIIETIVDNILEETDQKTNQLMADDSISFIDKIKQLMQVLPEYHQIYDRPILDEMKRYYPDQWVKMEDALEEDWDDLQKLIEQGIETGEIVSNYSIPVIMKVLIEAINTTLDQHFFNKNNITVAEALSQIVDILLYGLVPENKR
ncbi:TetR family transcriptional regulator [Sediminibacillus dalangtanensis]|uniref:TetR family transcriptional regulator n=1 Tax=Sediminibacillus dalangtanensis TaxID=2729421 RepID=A0ABX7VR65_9BACI|nr:TetR/AcrR family transcriptional regulator [Sediminibacillus dalangtanensis]QTM98070.1 TetR family transcriptional regulator [Sediminibacillus dalangtanensis]